MKIEFIPIKTRIVHPPKDDITDIINSLTVKDGDIIFITSKILGLHQGRTAKIGTIEKEDLNIKLEKILISKDDNLLFSITFTPDSIRIIINRNFNFIFKI